MTAAVESDFLLGMAESSRKRDARSRAVLSDAQLRSQLLCVDPPKPLRLLPDAFDIIAEIKKRSPAEGSLDSRLTSPEAQAEAYIAGGAAALSVLTEPEQFRGSLDDLHTVASRAVATPVMRKDFLVSRYQVREARLAGASGVLLIAAMLDTQQLRGMLDAAFELGMFVVLEVFEPGELDTCIPILESAGPPVDAAGASRYLIGVNCRDLRSLQVDFAHFARMAPCLPAGIPWVAESGVHEAAQLSLLSQQGYRMALVGTALMRSDDPAATVAEFRRAGARRC
jgi:indole-3-glycerol phosphate synthase